MTEKKGSIVGKTVPTWSRVDENNLSEILEAVNEPMFSATKIIDEAMLAGAVEFTTTGPRGGDAGHGGRSSVLIHLPGEGLFTVGVIDNNDFCNGKSIVITAAGDCEMEHMAEMFRSLANLIEAAE